MLNHHKSELICDEPSTRDEMLEEAVGLQLVSRENAELLVHQLVAPNLQTALSKERLLV